MKYRLVVGLSPTELVINVNKFIEIGWKPLGGCCISTSGNYFQAMIKEETYNQFETGPK